MLKIAVSSRSLFHLEDGNKIFETQGQEAFNEYMRSKENDPLRPGAAFPLVKKLLDLNSQKPPFRPDMVEVILLSRNSPDAGMRVMNSIKHYGLGIEKAVFTQGENRFGFVKAFEADLFLSVNSQEVEYAISQGVAAATLMPCEKPEVFDDEFVRIAFDGDSVIFASEADLVYQKEGIVAFRDHEVQHANRPLEAGPFKNFLHELHELQKKYPAEKAPVKVGLITARGLPAHERVLKTLRSWGIRIDTAVFCGGAKKGPLLQAFKADMFFDDMKKNVDNAHDSSVSSGHVPFGPGGIVS